MLTGIGRIGGTAADCGDTADRREAVLARVRRLRVGEPASADTLFFYPVASAPLRFMPHKEMR